MSSEKDRLLSNEERTTEQGDICGYGGVIDVQNSTHVQQATASTKPLKRRWYVLFVYSLMCFTLGASISTFGTIANSTERAFGWTDSDIALISNWQPIAFIVGIAFFSWLINAKGLRTACVLSAFFLAVGNGIRCISHTPPISNWCQHIGALLSGLASPIVYSAPSSVSSAWFPVDQRTTSTAISTSACSLGFAFVVMLAPALVHVHNGTDPGIGPSTASPHHNGTEQRLTDNSSVEDITETPPRVLANIIKMRQEISLLMYIQAGIAALAFLLMLVYFPSKPPVPPSASASTARMDLKHGVKKLLRNGRFWILCFVYSATNGVYSAYAGVLDVDLKATGIQDDQQVAGYMSFLAIIVLAVLGLAIARLADMFTSFIKLLMISLCILATAMMLWFSLILDGYIPFNMPCLYISFILGTLFINSALPLFYEMACECTYPVAEDLTNGALNLMNNFLGLVFYLVMMIPNIGASWMHWCVMGCAAACVPILIPFKQKYGRLEIDAIVTDVTLDEDEGDRKQEVNKHATNNVCEDMKQEVNNNTDRKQEVPYKTDSDMCGTHRVESVTEHTQIQYKDIYGEDIQS